MGMKPRKKPEKWMTVYFEVRWLETLHRRGAFSPDYETRSIKATYCPTLDDARLFAATKVNNHAEVYRVQVER